MDLYYHYTQLALEVLGVGDILPEPRQDGYEDHVYLTEGDFRRLQVEVGRWVKGVDAQDFEKAGMEGRIPYLEAALRARRESARTAPHREYAPKTIAALRAFDEGQSEEVPEQLLSEGLAAYVPFQEYCMLVLTDLGREVLRRAAEGNNLAREQHGSKAKVMPSAAKNTTGAGESAKLPEPKPYPTTTEKFGHEAVAQLAKVFRPGTSSVILTNEDRYILIVLDAHRGTALTYDQIANESVRMNRENPKKIKRLSDSAIRKRVPVLEALALVARPPGTEKKGIAITDAGHAAIN